LSVAAVSVNSSVYQVSADDSAGRDDEKPNP